MKNLILTTVFVLFASVLACAQGTLKGTIKSENGDTLFGANIFLKDNTFISTTANENGAFSLKIPDSLVHVISVSFIGYTPILDTLQFKRGKVLVINYVMKVKAFVNGGVGITKTKNKAKDTYMDEQKQKSSVSLDFITAETLKKTGDANLTAGVTRVSGVSTNGAFITVRGIGDRYVKTTFNGMRIPTLDPFTNNLKLDMFPASLVDNVIISKTASPDLPSDWAGAYISVQTKDYPDKLSVNVETSVGYNTQATFKDIISTGKSSTDWLGYDSDFRDQGIRQFVFTKDSPSKYDELVALGKGDYLNSLGVTSTEIFEKDADNYFKLGLVELGLLAKGQFHDPLAVSAAKQAYNQGPYKGDAFKVMNANAAKFNQSLPNNWRTKARVAPLNFSQSFTFGNKINLFKKPLGVIAGFRYSVASQYDPNSDYARIISAPVDGVYLEIDTLYQKVSKETNEWSALVNLAYKYHKNHGVTLLFMPNMNGVNNAGVATDPGGVLGEIHRQFYESRKQFIYQLKSEHSFAHNIKALGVASYTQGSSIVPDFKVVGLAKDTFNQNRDVINAARYFRYLSENIFDSKVSVDVPLKGDGEEGATKKIKMGVAYQRCDREYEQFGLSLIPNILGSAQLVVGNPNSDPLSLDKFDFGSVILSEGPTQRLLRTYFLDDRPLNRVIGNSTISAAFAMADYNVTSRLRLSGGLRVEHAVLFTDLFLFDSLQLATNDARRYLNNVALVNPVTLDEVNFLPSATAIYKLRKKVQAPINLRANFSQTVARPGLRELSPVSVFDYELNSLVEGNPDLKVVRINNYDLRFESYFTSGDNVSLSVFYKDFINYIEMFGSPLGFTWENNPNRAWLQGVELEGKKLLGKYFELRANLTFVDSRSVFQQKLDDGKGGFVNGPAITHTLFGQAPYLINTIASYNSDSLGLQLTLSYNVQGPRLVVEGNPDVGLPPVFERPRHLFDFKVSKKLGKYFGVSLKVNDILNSARVRTYRSFEGEYLVDFDSFRFGTNYVLSVSYKL